MSITTHMRVAPHMVLASNLLRLPSTDIDRLVADELANNSALALNEFRHRPRLREDDRRMRDTRGEHDDLDIVDRIAARETTIDALIAQARLMLRRDDLEIAAYLLHSLDEHGFLAQPREQLARELGASLAQVERVVRALHELTPPGIAARDARECLLIQCAQLETEGKSCSLLRSIIEHAWDGFLHQRWDQVARSVNATVTEVEAAVQFMRQHLRPYPLSLMDVDDGDTTVFAGVDVIVQRRAQRESVDYDIEIPGEASYDLVISDDFERALRVAEMGNDLSTEQRIWMHQSVERARIFINALQNRWTTLRRIAEHLITYQVDFLERGPRYLKPITRADVARELGVHESTVSRAVSDKVMQLPNRQLIAMSDLFDRSLAVKEAIRQVIGSTQRRMSDREIAERLREQGMCLARRTVAKYRSQLGIQPRPLPASARMTPAPRTC